MRLDYEMTNTQKAQIKYELAMRKLNVTKFCRANQIDTKTIMEWMSGTTKAFNREGEPLSNYQTIDKFIVAYDTLTQE